MWRHMAIRFRWKRASKLPEPNMTRIPSRAACRMVAGTLWKWGNFVSTARSPALPDRLLHSGHDATAAVPGGRLSRRHPLLSRRSAARQFRGSVAQRYDQFISARVKITSCRDRGLRYRRCMASRILRGIRRPACVAALLRAWENVALILVNRRKDRALLRSRVPISGSTCRK